MTKLESSSPNCVVGHLATTPRPLMCRSNNLNLGAPTLIEFQPHFPQNGGQKVYVPYVCHYNPRLVYVKPTCEGLMYDYYSRVVSKQETVMMACVLYLWYKLTFCTCTHTKKNTVIRNLVSCSKSVYAANVLYTCAVLERVTKGTSIDDVRF